eukprot:269452-Chlamydomonas_euryale.AAC.1
MSGGLTIGTATFPQRFAEAHVQIGWFVWRLDGQLVVCMAVGWTIDAPFRGFQHYTGLRSFASVQPVSASSLN